MIEGIEDDPRFTPSGKIIPATQALDHLNTMRPSDYPPTLVDLALQNERQLPFLDKDEDDEDQGNEQSPFNAYEVLMQERLQRLLHTKVYVAGLGTVGFSVLAAILDLPILGDVHLFEKPDERLESHNLGHQILFHRADLGKPKHKIASELIEGRGFGQRAVYHGEFPYLDEYGRGISQPPPIEEEDRDTALAFSALDDPKAMLSLHKWAKDNQIPVVLLTDVGENLIIQLFDYRQEGTKLFNGWVDEKIIEALKDSEDIDVNVRREFLLSLVGGPGKENLAEIPPRVIKILQQAMNGRFSSFPQTAMASSLVHHYAMRIMLENAKPEDERDLSKFRNKVVVPEFNFDKRALLGAMLRRLSFRVLNKVLAYRNLYKNMII